MFRFSASHPAVSRQQGGAVVEVEESKNRSFMGSDLIWKCHPRRYVTLLGVGRPRLRLAGIRILLVSGTSIHDPFNQFFIIKKEEIEKDNTNPRFFFLSCWINWKNPLESKRSFIYPSTQFIRRPVPPRRSITWAHRTRLRDFQPSIRTACMEPRYWRGVVRQKSQDLLQGQPPGNMININRVNFGIQWGHSTYPHSGADGLQ